MSSSAALDRADPFAGLAGLTGVGEAAAEARAAIDEVLWDRAVRARMAEVVAASRLQGGWASAALDGADLPPEAVRDGTALDDSPMGRVLAAALRLQEAVPGLVAVFDRAPAQAWAGMHSLVAHGFLPADELGRPRRDGRADDPLRLGPAPDAAVALARLDDLAATLTRPTAAPAVIVAAVAHAELLTVRPFAWGTGLIARAGVRLVLAGRGVDPDCACVPEAGLLDAGRTAYVRALRGYQAGTPEGVAAWLVFHCVALAAGARAVRSAGSYPA